MSLQSLPVSGALRRISIPVENMRAPASLLGKPMLRIYVSKYFAFSASEASARGGLLGGATCFP